MEENVQKSQDRILVTHAGSLPRGEPLGSMLIDQEAGKPVEIDMLKKAIEARVVHVLNKQVGLASTRSMTASKAGSASRLTSHSA